MNFPMVINILGYILVCLGGLQLVPLTVGIIYQEPETVSFVISALAALIPGAIIAIRKPANQVFHLREGYVITSLSWIVLSILGALPFVISGAIPNFVDAVFETASGFSTTGASILTEIESLPKCILFWRSFTHWIGGMGVLVFLLALLPLAGGSNINLMKAESPGPQVGKLVPKMRSTAKYLYGIYIGITILEFALLVAGKMPVFDAITATFGTVGTGGFAVKNTSIAGYSPYIQWVITVFMILCGFNFNFYFFIILRKFKSAFEMSEIKVYLGIIVAATVLMAVNTYNMFSNINECIRHSAFTVASIISSTGFATTDFNLWPEICRTSLVLLMFIGACAGSTGGGFKISRMQMLLKSLRKETKVMLHPQSIQKVMLDGKSIPHEVLRSTNVYLVTWIIVMITSTFLVSFNGFDFTTTFSSVISALNNIGPGLNMTGPTGNWSQYSIFSKLIFTFDMIAGRLELFPMLILFSRHTWQRF